MNCPKCGNPISSNTKFCAKCGTPVPPQPMASQPPVQTTYPQNNPQTVQRPQPAQRNAVNPQQQTPPAPQNFVTPQPTPQNVAIQPQKQPKKKKSSKNLPLIIVAVMLVLAVLASTIAVVPGIIRNKNEINSATEYIEEFPTLKQKTSLLVYDINKFPSEKYEIKVERMFMGGILNGVFMGETIIEEESTEHVYDLDFEKDGDYRITLTDKTEPEESTGSEETEVIEIVIIIDVKVDNDAEDAVDKVDINSEVLDEMPKTPLEALVGTYEGSYFPGQGETGLTLTVYNEGGAYKALFDFYSLPGRTNSKSGKYYMNVTYNEETKTYTLTGYEWIEEPSLYIFADLEGTLNGDVFSGEGPIKFSVTRINETADENKKEEVDFSQKVSKVNYYDFDGKLVYYEVYAYYDNGLLCSTTLYEQSDYQSSEYTLLYVYDKDGNLKDKCVGGLTIPDWFDESTGKVTMDLGPEVSIYPEKETLEQEKYGVDASKTKKEYGNPIIVPTDNTGDWAQTYINAIQSSETTDSTECKLIFVDNNNVPELRVDNVYMSAGGKVYTQKNNQISSVETPRGSVRWVEKENKILITGGSQGFYYDEVYEIVDGKFVSLARGEWNEVYSEDHTEIAGYEYVLNDVTMTEAEYKNALNNLFDESKAKDKGYLNLYTYDQCIMLLEYISEVG